MSGARELNNQTEVVMEDAEKPAPPTEQVIQFQSDRHQNQIKHAVMEYKYQVFVKLLDGKHRALNFESPLVSVASLKHRIQTLTCIPSQHQILIPSDNNTVVRDDDEFTIQKETFPLFLDLSLRLRGGKGGFGSLLRGAATKAGQKKTNNFDACRDMSGRRLRHVNAEKKLEKWRAEADERRLEKMAEDFLNKNAKDLAKSGKRNGTDSSEKYVAKYREQSAKCMEDVDKSVRESLNEDMSKRKSKDHSNHPDPKRLKIWLGKRTINDSDTDDSDGEPEQREDEKYVIIDNGSHSDSSKEAHIISSCTVLENESRDQGDSSESSPEEQVEKSLVASEDEEIVDKSTDADNIGENIDYSAIKKEVEQLPGDMASKLDVAPCAELHSSFQPEAILEQSVSTGVEALDLDNPLNFDGYHSAAEMEVLGMERLKMELQSRGLKCGGTLSERAARLFLLKTTPLDMLPKKLFAKK